MSEDKCCKDCPCAEYAGLPGHKGSPEIKQTYKCKLSPPQERLSTGVYAQPLVSGEDWCYRGRQIMAGKDEPLYHAGPPENYN
jgi:hypothetical protein